MKYNQLHNTVNIFISIVWLVNGLLCKLLNLVPRHEKIVSRILGSEHSALFTKLIGVSEIMMAAWIISGKMSWLNAVLQILIIASMNIIEFVFAPDLLLWGKANSVFAFLFVILIYYNQFY